MPSSKTFWILETKLGVRDKVFRENNLSEGVDLVLFGCAEDGDVTAGKSMIKKYLNIELVLHELRKYDLDPADQDHPEFKRIIAIKLRPRLQYRNTRPAREQ